MPRSMNMSGVAMGSRMGPPTIGLERAGMLDLDFVDPLSVLSLGLSEAIFKSKS